MKQKSPTKWLVLAVAIVLVVIVILQYQYFSTTGLFKMEDRVVSHQFDAFRIVSAGPGLDKIPSIDRPDFENVASANEYLDDAQLGVVVQAGGQYRFYPFQILVWHEVVNDEFGGNALLISYSPLTYTANVYNRTINTEALLFGVSGELYENNTLLFDRSSNSRWLQVTGEAVVGEKMGMKLEPYPSLVMSWNGFKQTYPTNRVLSRETGFERDYTHDPHGSYYTNNAVLFPLSVKDNRYHPKELVYGFTAGESQMAFFEEVIEKQEVINAQVGEESIVVVMDPAFGTVRGFERVIDGQKLTFTLEKNVLVDKETSSRWNLNGEAFSGSSKGKQLNRVQLHLSFWFSWFANYPLTSVSTGT